MWLSDKTAEHAKKSFRLVPPQENPDIEMRSEENVNLFL
jgi:hypothetical protein